MDQIEHSTESTKPDTYEDLASLLEHRLLEPELTETDVANGVELASRYGVAAVVVRPSDLDLAANWVKGSTLILGTVADWPFGYSPTAVKTYGVRDLLRRGAKQIDTIMNTGKLRSRQFQYLEMELAQIAEACHQSGAVVNVTLESQYLDEELKILACRICRRASVDSIASPLPSDAALLKEYSKERLLLHGSVSTLEEAQQFREAGYSRLSSSQTALILDAWKAKLAEAMPVSVIS